MLSNGSLPFHAAYTPDRFPLQGLLKGQTEVVDLYSCCSGNLALSDRTGANLDFICFLRNV